MVLNLFRRRAIFQSQKLWRAKGFYPPKTPHDRGGEPDPQTFLPIHYLYLATTFFSPRCPKLGGPFINAPRAFFYQYLTISFISFTMDDSFTWRKNTNILNVLGGPLLARGSEVSRAIFQGAAGHFWPAGQGLRTTGLLYII